MRFLIIGGLTVLVDYATYRLLLGTAIDVGWAKAIGFLTGTVFAYFANRAFTFAATGAHARSAIRFAALYATTLGVNVLVNAMLIHFAGPLAPAYAVTIAFLGATFVSAALNFVGMKHFVFESGRPAS